MSGPIIASTDIDQTKFGNEEYQIMKSQFPGETDETIVRFLIARNNDVTKASAMLAAHIEWRKSNWPVLKNSCLNEINKGKVYVHGTDNEGHPLLIYRVRMNNSSDRDVEEMGRMIMFFLATAVNAMPPDKSKFTILFDRTNFSKENSDIEFMRHMTPIMQNNFPERVHRVIVYPSGFVFYGIWNIVKWFLDPVTQAKVQPMLALSGVQQYINDEYISRDLGGECDFEFDPDLFPDPYSAEVLSAAYPDEGSSEK